jgi:hypothetical protein
MPNYVFPKIYTSMVEQLGRTNNVNGKAKKSSKKTPVSLSRLF